MGNITESYDKRLWITNGKLRFKDPMRFKDHIWYESYCISSYTLYTTSCTTPCYALYNALYDALYDALYNALHNALRDALHRANNYRLAP